MKALPVDPERLRKQFSALTDEDLEAYARVTQTVLGDPAERGKSMAALLARARGAREKTGTGRALSRDEDLALRYLVAVEKMQGKVGTK